MNATATFILTETVVYNGVTSTRRVEVTGDLEQVRHVLATRSGLLAASRCADQVATTPTARGDVYQAEIGCTVNEALEAQRQQRLWARDWRPPATPCGPSRRGLLTQFVEMFEAY